VWAQDQRTGLPALDHDVERTVTHIAAKQGTLKDMMDQVERWLLTKALQAHRGNKTKAAAALGMSRENLHKKLAKLDLRPPPREIENAVVRPPKVKGKGTYKAVRRQVERWLVAEALRDHGGNRTKAAAALDLRRETLHKKLLALGLRGVPLHIDKKRFRIDLQRVPREIEPRVRLIARKKGTLKAMMRQVESLLLAEALRDHGDNKRKAAAALGIARDFMYKKLAKLGMHAADN
jgi:transcriptional regulator with PAS, ATPase and Fis domain